MSKNIDFRIETFIKSASTKSDASASKLARLEVKYLRENYKVSTIQTLLTKYRNALKTIATDKKPYLRTRKTLTILKSEQNALKSKYERKLVAQSKSRKPVRNADKMVKIALQLLNSEKYSDIVIALCLLTGRRMTEILKTAKFTNSKNSQKCLYFRGQLKTTNTRLKYEIYTLADSRDLCKDALKRLRSILDTGNMSNTDVARKYETTINATCHKYFSSFIGQKDIDRCSCHDLRNIYALLCSREHRPIEQTESSFIAQILGHDVDGLKTAQSYQKFYLSK